MLTSHFFVNCMKSSLNKQTNKNHLYWRKKIGQKKETVVMSNFFAVASVLAFCTRVNIDVLISWDIVRAENARKKNNNLITISFYSVLYLYCCAVVYILPLSETEKSMKIESKRLKLKWQLENQRIVVVPTEFLSFFLLLSPHVWQHDVNVHCLFLSPQFEGSFAESNGFLCLTRPENHRRISRSTGLCFFFRTKICMNLCILKLCCTEKTKQKRPSTSPVNSCSAQ